MQQIKDQAESVKPFSVGRIKYQLSNVGLKCYLPIDIKWIEYIGKKIGGIVHTSIAMTKHMLWGNPFSDVSMWLCVCVFASMQMCLLACTIPSVFASTNVTGKMLQSSAIFLFHNKEMPMLSRTYFHILCRDWDLLLISIELQDQS